VVDADGNARAPSEMDMLVRLPGMDTVHYVTDNSGARVEQAVDAQVKPEWLFVGDSQMLGWGLEFEDSLPGRMARLHGQQMSAVRILASSRQDPVGLLAWARDYTRLHPSRHRVVAVGINLGNDLDEIYFRHYAPSPLTSSRMTEWLSLNSIAFLDFSRLLQALRGRDATPGFAGVNTAMVLIGDDPHALQALIADTVRGVSKLFAALPAADQRVVIIIPQDSQVALAEFDKYRNAYRDDPTFEKAREMQARAIRRLDKAEFALMKQLQALGYCVISTHAELQRHYTASGYFDRNSHHLLRNAAAAAAAAFDSDLPPTR